MIRLAVLLAFLSAPAMAQDHSGDRMPAADPHVGHRMAAPAAAPAAAEDAEKVGTDLEPGSAPAPTPPTDRYADRFWSPAAMQAARDQLHREHGAMVVGMTMLNIAEWQPDKAGDRFRWDAEGWYGGDTNRLTVKSEGEGVFRDGVERAEVQALYSRALDAYWNFQAGIRQDAQPGPRRSYATIGVEGLAPYWFEVEGALFLSQKGEVSGRIEAYYDQRLTQRLILQPRSEIEFALQDSPTLGVGRGVGEASVDLRLRYEIAREFAPYIGVSHERSFGRTARFVRASGEDRSATRLAVGVRAWF